MADVHSTRTYGKTSAEKADNRQSISEKIILYICSNTL